MDSSLSGSSDKDQTSMDETGSSRPKPISNLNPIELENGVNPARVTQNCREVSGLKVNCEKKKGVGYYIIDVKCAGEGHVEKERVCRVCHLSSDNQSSVTDLIQLGCECLNDLAIAHRRCAEAWFRIKGDKRCEICGVVAENIKGVGSGSFLLEWNHTGGNNRGHGEANGLWRRQPLCTFVMASVVISFVLLWFFRVDT
ncbi:hypothetical protein AMTR_s00023p00139440 [Amborella trichopoda]|uniref:RING-CH-type domain-containing protein n=1 Tax=Amborella trichopoda TaxID=13333 RepID=W1NK88_AMBTC|nr:hypothetical protein AMTR_s00023p00139440 [Amborella trichopoda]